MSTELQTKNLKGKTRPVSDPYEVWVNDSGWTWLVLKHYQSPAAEAKNPYARVFCDVSSPYTHGGSDLGDVYLSDIINHAHQTDKVITTDVECIDRHGYGVHVDADCAGAVVVRTGPGFGSVGLPRCDRHYAARLRERT